MLRVAPKSGGYKITEKIPGILAGKIESEVMMQRSIFCRVRRLIICSSLMLVTVASVVEANGFTESAPWQFQSDAKRGVNVAMLDMIERKKGGYYNGFTSTLYNSTITNVGTQINCSNSASANGNNAQNSLGGSNAQLDAVATISSTSNGNDSLTGSDSGAGTTETNQTNSGTQSSDVTDSTVGTTTGGIVNGDTQNDLNNDQENSGNQSASNNDSVACDMNGSVLNGNVDGNFNGQQLSGPLN